MCTLSRKYRERWLQALLPHVKAMGWTHEAATIAARAAGLSEGEQALAAPNGISDIVDHLFSGAADAMVHELAITDFGQLRTHERVALAVKTWLGALEPHRVAVRKAAAHALLPPVTGVALRRTWRLADTIWSAAGDTATDYNRYTKRMLLAATLPGIVMYWTGDPCEADLDAHIGKRLQQAMMVGRAGSRILAPILNGFNRSGSRHDDERH